tara:strand:+ start:24 stop:908 length:885 start_codon:yes stop_codon:yes gene_type:complete
MKQLKVSRKVSEKESSKFLGLFAEKEHYDLLLDEDVIVTDKDTGNTICLLKKNAVPNSVCKKSYPSARQACSETDNRGTATAKGSRHNVIKKDGVRSNTTRTKYNISSSICGYFDRYPRIPYCRMTAFTEYNFEAWADIARLVILTSDVFKKYLPNDYRFMRQAYKKVCKDFRIPDSVFTTTTVNRNWRTAYHRDKKNLTDGFASMLVLGMGEYQGGYLVLPEYRVALNVYSTDVIVMNNTTLIHGNSEIIGKRGEYERISLVNYLRAGMLKCGTLEHELNRAKKHGASIQKEI